MCLAMPLAPSRLLCTAGFLPARERPYLNRFDAATLGADFASILAIDRHHTRPWRHVCLLVWPAAGRLRKCRPFAFSRVLDGHEKSPGVWRKGRATDLAAYRPTEEQTRPTALRTFGVHHIYPIVGLDRARLAVSGNPQTTTLIESKIVRCRQPAPVRMPLVGSTVLRHRRIAARHEQLPAERS